MMGSVPFEMTAMTCIVLLLGSLLSGVYTAKNEQQGCEQFFGLITLNAVISCLPDAWPVATCFMVMAGQALLFVSGVVLAPEHKMSITTGKNA